MISGSNEQLQQQLEYTLRKPDCHSWWISKVQSDILEGTIESVQWNSVLNLEKCHRNVLGALYCFWTTSCMTRASVFEWHKRFKESRESVRDDERYGRSKEVNNQSWLGLLCWGFKGVQEEIPREEACTHQIGSVAFPAGQCTSPQLHPCQRLFEQDRHQDGPELAPCDFWLFPKLTRYRYETIAEMKVCFMCVLSIKVPIRKKAGNLSSAPRISFW